MKPNRNIRPILTLALLFIVFVAVFAQPSGPPGGGGGGEVVGGGAGVPLDGGTISLLIAGGIFLSRKYLGKVKTDR